VVFFDGRPKSPFGADSPSGRKSPDPGELCVHARPPGGTKTGREAPHLAREDHALLEELLRNNRAYAASFNLAAVPALPAKELFVLTCMDARLNPERILGLPPGSANIFRNAGGRVTEDALRSLLASQHSLGTRAVLILQHTDCGMAAVTDDSLIQKIIAHTGPEATEDLRKMNFRTIPGGDVRESVRGDLEILRNHPWLKSGPLVGGIYDVFTGRVEIVAVAHR